MRIPKWYKLFLMAGLPLILSCSAPAVAQKNPPAKTYQPGFWQPIGRVNPKRPIQITVVNQDRRVIEYGLTEQRGFTKLKPGTSGPVYTKALPMYLVIYPARVDRLGLKFDVVVGSNNDITITVTQAPEGQAGHHSIDIDQTGAVYRS